jgi:hypothetical protein
VSTLFNALLEDRRVFQCSAGHGPVMVVALKTGPLVVQCPICTRRITAYRDIAVMQIDNIQIPFRKERENENNG